MAIHDDSQTSQPGTTQPPSPGVGAQAPNYASADPRAANQRETVTPNINSGLFGSPLPSRMGSKQYNEAKKKLLEIFETVRHPDLEIRILDMDKTIFRDHSFSAMIVTAASKSRSPVTVSYHILLLEATGKKFEPLTDTFHGTSTEIVRPTSVALDDLMISNAVQVVTNAYQGANLRPVDYTVVPENFNFEDEAAVYGLALNTGLAVAQEVRTSAPEFRDINLVEFVPRDSQLNVNLAFSPQQLNDVVGQPVRSDILVSFRTQRMKDNKYVSVNSGDREQTVTEVSGFIDLMPIAGPSQSMMYAGQPAPLTHRFAPRLVLTSIAANYAYTPAGVLMAMVTALEVGSNNNWVQTFRPLASNPNDRSIDLRDIGALNIEANIAGEKSDFGTPINTKSPDFDLRDLGQLVGAMVRPSLYLSLDAPVAGPSTWYTSLFAAAAAGSVDARNNILNALNQLTNGQFQQHYNGGNQLFIDVGNRVHLGYWFDDKGQKRDMRDFDLTAVANRLGRGNPAQIREWTKTWFDHQQPLDQRLAKRLAMIRAMSNETAVVTDFADRLTWDPVVIDAIAKAVHSSGIAVRTTTPLSAADFNYQRPVADFATHGGMSPGQQVFHPSNFGQRQAGFGYHQYAGNRWGR